MQLTLCFPDGNDPVGCGVLGDDMRRSFLMVQGTCTLAEYRRMVEEKAVALQMSTAAFIAGRGQTCPGAFHKSSAGKRQAAPSKGMTAKCRYVRRPASDSLTLSTIARN